MSKTPYQVLAHKRFDAYASTLNSQLRSRPKRRDLIIQQPVEVVSNEHTARMCARQNSRSQEVSVVLARDLAGEILGGQLELVTGRRLGDELSRLLLEETQRVRLVDAPALGGADAVPAPLPQLAAADLGGRGVLLLEASATRLLAGKRG